MLTIAVERLIELYLDVFELVLRVFEPFRKPHHLEPHATLARDYEWHDTAFCVWGCYRYTNHRYIEWLPDRVTTRECLACGYETEVFDDKAPREEA